MACTAVEQHAVTEQHLRLIKIGNKPTGPPVFIILEDYGPPELVSCDEYDSNDDELVQRPCTDGGRCIT